MCLKFAKSAVEVILLDKDLLERRLFELKLEGDGLTLKEIVAETSIKFSCHTATVYREMAHRALWQPLLQEFSEALLKAKNCHVQLYRKASFMYSQAKSDRARIAALNLMRQINIDLAELSGAKPTEQTQSEEINIRWEDPEVCKKQYASDTNPIPDNANSTTAPQGSECSTVGDAGAKQSRAPTNS
jgi:hypothetical protein